MYKPISDINLEDLMTGIAQSIAKQPVMRTIKDPDAPAVKIRCKCSHAKRYHGDKEDGYIGQCYYCGCKEFRFREEKEQEKKTI